MGEVYLARDTKLNRDVAVKILPELFATDPERLARFKREAQVLAALNHQGIAHVYGLEDANGQTALVMEFVPGATLAANPVWAADGRAIYFGANDRGRAVYRVAGDGTGAVEQVTTVQGSGNPNFVTARTKQLIFSQVTALTERDLWLLVPKRPDPVPLIVEPGSQGNPTVSPDERWIAYGDERQGQIFVRPFQDVGGGRLEVVSSGAKWPVWSSDGRTLYYQTGQTIMSVPIEPSGSFIRARTPTKIIEYEYSLFGGITGPRNYDVHPKNGRILAVRELPTAPDEAPRLVVVERWFDELERRAPVN